MPLQLAEWYYAEMLNPTRWSKLGEKMLDPVIRFAHWRWTRTEAQVRECTSISYSSTYTFYGAQVQPQYSHSVTFTYEVDGKTYHGKTKTMDEYRENDKIVIVYNPRHPEKNYGFQAAGGSPPSGKDTLSLLLALGLGLLELLLIYHFRYLLK